jgi:hypothetical protein
VMCRLRPEARSQAGPDLWPEMAFGPAWDTVMDKQSPLIKMKII